MGRKSKYDNSTVSTSEIFRAGMYLRLSREDGDKMESDSIASQRAIIEKFIQTHDNIILAETYIDDGFTGTNFNRPDFKRMEQDWENKQINCIIVKDLSRFGRDYIDMGNYLERVFPTLDIRFIAINDGYDNYNQQDNDTLMVPVKNVFNGYYAKDIQKKVNSSLNQKRQEGLFLGSFTTYGYKRDTQDKHKLVIDEYPASIVRRIFNEYNQGKGQIAIAKALNDEKILCPSAYKSSKGLKYKNCNKLNDTSYWTYATVHRILLNQMYIGDMVQGKTHRKIMKGKATMNDKKDWVIVKGTHEPIIDKDLWESVQRQFTVDTRQDIIDGMQNNVHIFAGLIVCADCKRAMSKNKTNKTFYYVCSSNKRYGKCTRHAIKYDVIYNIVLEDLNKCIENIKDLQHSIESNRPIIKQNNDSIMLALKHAKSELAKVQRLKKGLYEDYKAELLTQEEYLSYRDDYTTKEKAFLQEVETLEAKSNQTPESIFENSRWIVELLKYKKITKLDRDIVLKMVDSIEVSENNVINITYNFSDELDSILNSKFQIK